MKIITTRFVLNLIFLVCISKASERSDQDIENYYRNFNISNRSSTNEDVLRIANKISLLNAIMHGSLRIIYNNNTPIVIMPHYESSAENLVERLVLTDFRLLAKSVLDEKNINPLISGEENKRNSIEAKYYLYLEKLDEFKQFKEATDLTDVNIKKKDISIIKHNRQELLTALKSGTIEQIESAISKPVTIKTSATSEKKKCDLQ
ncbi:MAG: hypothetical protein ACOYT8_02710 [Candidatus Dependentiae bacterium]